MKNSYLFILLFFPFLGFGQVEEEIYPEESDSIEIENETRLISEPNIVDPQFPGGEEALKHFIKSNLQYPEIAKEMNEQGIVYVQFVINEDGSVSDIEVIRGVSDALDREAVRIIESFPKWIPGTKDNKPVKVKFTIPIQFRLN